MYQIQQHLRTGEVQLIEIPTPSCKPNHVLVKTSMSLISSGTEKMLNDFSNANLFNKALQQPDRVKQVIQKAKTDGIGATYKSVKSKLNQPLPMGYCNVGKIIEVGTQVDGFSVGDRIASNASHSEFALVSKNLIAKIPDSISDSDACFTSLISIALQSVRLIKPSIGETIGVIGLGVIGQLALQIIKANGCKAIGFDISKNRVNLARSLGFESLELQENLDVEKTAQNLTNGIGLDAVIIATATASNAPIEAASLMTRQRGKVILLGTAGLNISRELFYKKELTFQVSCSYGPGRYDPDYEVHGMDYPIAFVRWTEQRNFSASLALIEQGYLNLQPLITHAFRFQEAQKAYKQLSDTTKTLGIVLKYPGHSERVQEEQSKKIEHQLTTDPKAGDELSGLGVIGAGNYAMTSLLPAFQKANGTFESITSERNLSAHEAKKRFKIKKILSGSQDVFDSGCKSVIIATRHDTHANLVCEALLAGKNVFVEKPLCLNSQELDKIEKIYSSLEKPLKLMVGFNRRFSPLIKEAKELLAPLSGPKSFAMTINAGMVDDSHWIHDPILGGGRLIGECCHFVDLLLFLAESKVVESNYIKMDSRNSDTFSISLKFGDGSIGVINYFSNGHKSVPKERLEIYASGKVINIENYRRLNASGFRTLRNKRLLFQDKGQFACAKAFLDSVEANSPSPINFAEIKEVMNVLLRITKS